MSRFTLDIIGPTTLGKDLCSLTRKEDVFIRAFLDLLGPTKGRLVLFVLYLFAPEVILRRMPTKINEVLDKNMIIVRTVCGDVVNEKRSALCNHRKLTTDSTSHDILSQIISAGNLTNYEIVDQMLTFLAAGVSLILLMHIVLVCYRTPTSEDMVINNTNTARYHG